MARNKAGITTIETWKHHKYPGEETVIKLDRQHGTFMAEYGDDMLRSKDLEDLRNQLTALVDEQMQIEWQPVIEATCQTDVRYSRRERAGRHMVTHEPEESPDRAAEGKGSLQVDFQRYWVGKTPSGNWMRCTLWDSQDEGSTKANRELGAPLPRRLNAREWPLPVQVALKGQEFKLPFTEVDTESWRHNPPTHYLPYTPELWAGLNEVAYKLEELGKKLEELIGSEKGVALLSSLVGKLLPESTEPSKKAR